MKLKQMNAGLHAERAHSSSSGFVPIHGAMLQRKCACGGSSGLTGTCSECEKKKLLGQPLQTKLRVNEPGDEYEQEADRVAAQVMRMAESKVNAKYSPPHGGPAIQRKVVKGNAEVGGVPPIVHEALSSPGQALDADTRAFFETRFAHDFSRVRVHADAKAMESAHAVNSLAYTVGSDIVFSAGQAGFGTTLGRTLLAHELTHVAQQGRTTANTLRRKEGDGTETDAPKSPPPSAPAPAATSACGGASLAATIAPSDKRLNGTPVEATLGATDFGNTSKLGADFRFTACKVGTNWRFQLDGLVVPIASKVQPVTHRIDIPTASGSNVTKESHPKIVSDLSPTTTGTFSVSCGGKSFKDKVTTYSPREKYWNQRFVIDHEAFHRKDWTDMYRTELAKAESDVWAHSLAVSDAKDAAAAVAKANPDLTKYMTDAYQRLCDVFTPAKESRAYDAGAAAYQKLVDEVNDRAKNEKWI